MRRISSWDASSDPGATQRRAKSVADECRRLTEPGGTVEVYGKGCGAIIKELLAKGVSAKEVAAPKGARASHATTTLDVCAKAKSGTVRARVDVVARRQSGELPAPETVTVGGREWATQNLCTSRYKRGSGLPPVVQATGPKHFGALTKAGTAACIYPPVWDPTAAANDNPGPGSRAGGLMFNKHVIISALECPVDYEVSSGDDWNELLGAIVEAKGTDTDSMLAEFEAQTFKMVGYANSYAHGGTTYDGYTWYVDRRGVWWTDTKDQVFFTGVLDNEQVGGRLNTVGAPIVFDSSDDSLWTLLTPVDGGADNPQSVLGFPVRLIKKVAA